MRRLVSESSSNSPSSSSPTNDDPVGSHPRLRWWSALASTADNGALIMRIIIKEEIARTSAHELTKFTIFFKLLFLSVFLFDCSCRDGWEMVWFVLIWRQTRVAWLGLIPGHLCVRRNLAFFFSYITRMPLLRAFEIGVLSWWGREPLIYWNDWILLTCGNTILIGLHFQGMQRN